MKSSLGGLKSRFKMTEEISELEDRTRETIQSEKQTRDKENGIKPRRSVEQHQTSNTSKYV